MKLSGYEQKELCEALVDAYRSQNALKRMVRFQLEENLGTIAGEGKLRNVAFDLIDWADAEGKLERLILGAYEENPGNPQLKAFYEKTFKQRFIPHPWVAKREVGPDIDWRGATEEIQLQSFLKTQPDWYDVVFLKRALESAASVCRLDYSHAGHNRNGRTNCPQLVLTNYHVLKLNEREDLQTNARDVVLQFGCLTTEGDREVETGAGHFRKNKRSKTILKAVV